AVRVAEHQGGGAVAHYQPLAIPGQAPALAGIREGGQGAEARALPYQGLAGFPGQLQDAVAHQGDALTELPGAQGDAAQYPAGGQLDLPQAGVAVQPGALVEAAVGPGEALGEGGGIVGMAGDDLVTL